MDQASSQPNSPSPTADKPVSIWLAPVAAVLLIVLVAMMTGCDLVSGTSQPGTPTVEVEPTPETETAEENQPTPLPPGVTLLVFWEPFSLDRPQGILLGEMIRDFEAQNPDILVELVAKNGYLGLHGAMLRELPNGELPDLAVAFPSMIAEYAAVGAVAPLDRYIYDPELGLDEEDLADIFAAHLAAGRLPGFGAQILAFPFAQNAIGMWVNDTLLAQAGWDHAPTTWPEFEQACWDVAAATGVNCYPFVESVTTFTAWLYSRGGQPLDDRGQQATFGSPAGVESLALLRRLMDAGLAWRPAEPYGDYVAFANGQAAFAFSSTGNGRLYADAYEGALHNGLAPFRWRQTLIPQADPQQPATALYGSSFFVLQGDLETEQAAWRLIRWFTDTEQTARWAAELEGLPVRASALEVMTDTLAAYPFVQAQVEEILPYGQPEPAVPEALQMRDILYTAILSVTQDYVDPQLALEQAVHEVNRALNDR